MTAAPLLKTILELAEQGHLLWVWGDIPFPPTIPPEPRGRRINQWRTEALRLEPIAWPLAALPHAPVLSLDPTNRLSIMLNDPKATIWRLGGEIRTGTGLLVTWDDVTHCTSHPEKARLIAAARATCSDGLIVILVPKSGIAFGRVWKAALGPALAPAARMVLGVGPGPWPPGIVPFADTLEPIVQALRQAARPETPATAKETNMDEEYADFELHITPQGHAVARSDEGESPAAPVEPILPKLLQFQANLVERKQVNADLLKGFGKELYDLLFPGPIHTHLQQTEAAARARGAKLRLRLRIEHDGLATLPLEFLYRVLGGYFFAVNPRTALSRYLNVPLPFHRTRDPNRPLHLLTIVADPIDQVRLDPDEWEAIARDALKTPIKEKRITLRTVKRATRREIRDALLETKPDVLQFVGHGIYRNGKGYLALVDETSGGTWKVDDEQFANLFLGSDDRLGLVSMATCESAKSESPQGFLGIAPQIVQRGVPAVVAMQYSVLIRTAKVFLEDFYTALAASKPLDWAVQAARNAIAQEQGLDNREFATPVLYMRAKDGKVF